MKDELKDRKFTLRLTDSDCRTLSAFCGRHDITIETLLENFISDLIAGSCTNGSDERMYAREYFERTWMSYLYKSDQTLLSFLLEDLSLDLFVDLTNDLTEVEKEYKYCSQHPEETNEDELRGLQEDIENCRENRQELIDTFITICEKQSVAIDRELRRVTNYRNSVQSLCKYGVSIRWDESETDTDG